MTTYQAYGGSDMSSSRRPTWPTASYKAHSQLRDIKFTVSYGKLRILQPATRYRAHSDPQGPQRQPATRPTASCETYEAPSKLRDPRRQRDTISGDIELTLSYDAYGEL